MRRDILIILVFLQIVFGISHLKAQPNSLYYLKGVPQTKDLNPARPGIEKGFYIGMPLASKLDVSFNTNNWSYNDLIHRGSGTMSDFMVWDFEKYLSSLDKNNFINVSSALTLFEFGWKGERDFYSFSWTERQFAEPFFTKNLANLLYYGNEPYIGSTYHSGYFGVGAAHYRELAFTFARELNKKISVGITGKMLFGLAGIKTSGLNFVGGMPISGDQIDLGASGKVSFSAPFNVDIQNNNGYQMFAKDNFDLNNYFSNFGNPGVAVDLGFSNKVSEDFEWSVSIVDLGFITWTKDVTTFTENGHFLYSGVNLDVPTNTPPTTTNVKKLFYDLNNSILDAFSPVESNSSFASLLPVKLYLAGEYKLNDGITLGGLARVRIFNNQIHTSLTASANARITRNLSMSASYSAMESTYDNVGFAAAFKLGFVQLYAASDNVPAFFQPTTARNANLRFGINLIFQDPATKKWEVYKRRQPRAAPGCPF